MLDLLQTPFFLPTTTMCPILSAKRSFVISLLNEGYSLCQVKSKIGIGKSTIARIKKKVDSDKENGKGGCPTKLSHHDKQSILRQIITGRLDNAV